MKTARLSIALSLLGLLTACGGGDTGTVSVLLKDGPGDFDAAVVTITEIDLVGSNGTTVLSTEKTTTNLLTLANDTATLVNKAVVPAGTYTQLRFVIAGAYIAVKPASGPDLIYASSQDYEGLTTIPPPAGAVHTGSLQMPSYGQSGLKVDLPATVQTLSSGAKVVLVDFDVEQSFGQVAGASGQWVMHPVLTATDFAFTGRVDVTLALASGVSLPAPTTLADFTAKLTAGGGSSTTIAFVAGTSGTYAASFLYVAPGSYQLTITAPTGVTSFVVDPGSLASTGAPAVTTFPTPVTVTSGQLTTVPSITITSVLP